MSTAPQRYIKHVSELVNAAVDMRGLLDTGELLTGTPTVVEVTTTDLTLTSKAINSSAVVVNGESCAAGQAVTFRVAGGVAGSQYTIRITASTNATPAQTRIVKVRLGVIAD